MEPWSVKLHKDALKDMERACQAGYKAKIQQLYKILKEDPFTSYPPYEKLSGDLKGQYSRRINQQHRLVYKVNSTERTVYILSLWTHYE